MPKKRSPGDGGLFYIKSRGLYRGVIDAGFWPDGRRRQVYVHGKTMKIAQAKLAQKKAEIAAHDVPLDRTTTMAKWSAHWLTTVARESYTPNALAAAESVTRTWIVPAIGSRIVATLKPSDVRAVVKRVRDAGRATATARKVYDVLSLMLESARLDGLAARNVAADVVAPKVVTEERGSIDTKDALAILKTAAEDVDGTRWWVTLLDGLRQAERLGAQLADLDLESAEPTLTVAWTLDEITSEHGCGEQTPAGWPCGKKQGAACPQGRLKVSPTLEYRQLSGRLCLKRPKSGKVRVVPLPASVAAALRRYVIATADRPNPHGLIWRHEDGSPILPGEDEQDWRELLLRAGVITTEQTKAPKYRAEGTPKPPTTHWARHTTATVLMELGVDAKVIGEIVGHGTERTTRGYQHVTSATARAALDALGAHYSDALGS